MSLLTDALRLREGRMAPRGERGPSFPPFRGPQPGRWIVGVLAVCVLAVLGWWKGAWLIETVERLAGVVPAPPTENRLANAPQEETGKAGENPGPAAVQDAPARAAENPAGPAAAPAISPEGKKRGDILITDNLVKSMAEKPGESVPTPPPGDLRVAAVPADGLQPISVELAEAELVMETPEEREKKRTEAVEEFLRVLKVQGVRLQGADSRILVDGAPIGLGEKVGVLGLVLESVEPQKIIFSDASGKKYPKSY